MARPLRYTLVSDGPTDCALLPIIDWVLRSLPQLADRDLGREWADLRQVEHQPGLAGKIHPALQHYPCDVLFVHRDAESSDRRIRQQRLAEIEAAMAAF